MNEVGELGDYAWYFDNTYAVGEDYGHAVGTKRPNPWGLYDMHGNVWEWCQDWFDAFYFNMAPSIDPPGPAMGFYRVLRGGGFFGGVQSTRSADRRFGQPVDSDSFIGARLLRVK